MREMESDDGFVCFLLDVYARAEFVGVMAWVWFHWLFVPTRCWSARFSRGGDELEIWMSFFPFPFATVFKDEEGW